MGSTEDLRALRQGADFRPPSSRPNHLAPVTGTARERSVYRYFDLADCFVQIVALENGALTLTDRPGLGRAGYRKLVIR